MLDPGDEVVIPAPYWVSYPEQVKLADGVPVIVPADESTGFLTSAAQIESVLTPQNEDGDRQLAVEPDRRGLHAVRRCARSPNCAPGAAFI